MLGDKKASSFAVMMTEIRSTLTEDTSALVQQKMRFEKNL